jgi:hypothetical protein
MAIPGLTLGLAAVISGCFNLFPSQYHLAGLLLFFKFFLSPPGQKFSLARWSGQETDDCCFAYDRFIPPLRFKGIQSLQKKQRKLLPAQACHLHQVVSGRLT